MNIIMYHHLNKHRNVQHKSKLVYVNFHKNDLENTSSTRYGPVMFY